MVVGQEGLRAMRKVAHKRERWRATREVARNEGDSGQTREGGEIRSVAM